MSERVRLFGCDFDAVDLTRAIERVEVFVRDGGFHQGCGVNVDQLVKMDRDPAFRSLVARCQLVTADGMPVVWASRALGRPLPARVPAIDLADELLAVAARRGWAVYLLGARSEVLDRAIRRYRRRDPDLRIVGHHHGYFDDDREAAIAAEIRAAGPQLLFIGISSPKKERFVERQRRALRDVPFVLGVGGAFDIAAGATRRAPPWLARAGLEWTVRLAQEPRRLTRRYLIDDLRFARLLGREWIGRLPARG
jgi:N-acetylglucosaminyldiphosphoundecaprenol N-acetyl-beta-D-mannosaminyltransferase